MFTAAIFTMIKSWQWPKRPPEDRWVNTRWCIHTNPTEQAKDKLLIHTSTWMNRKATPCQRSQIQGHMLDACTDRSSREDQPNPQSSKPQQWCRSQTGKREPFQKSAFTQMWCRSHSCVRLSKHTKLYTDGGGHTAVYNCPNTPNCTLKRINLYYVNQTSIQVLMASHIPMGESRRGGALTLPVSAPSQARHTSPKIQQSNPKYFPQKNENTGPRQTCKKCSVLFLIAKNGK